MSTGASFRRLQVLNFMTDTCTDDMRQDVFEGLTARQKFLPSKYFYDARGSSLFEKICRLPEYYQTRTELSILRSVAPDIMNHLTVNNIVDLGSGANLKIKTLLDARNGLQPNIRYIPVDVCGSAMQRATEELLFLYPDVTVLCIVADFTRHLKRISIKGRKLIALFGSTIGNFDEAQGTALLKNIASTMGPADLLLVGVDMIKPKSILEAAYNDSQGVTAAFNKNILSVLNRELKAHFDLSDFDHVAFFNEARQRVEMHLRAKRDISTDIELLDIRIDMNEGETIHTEICRKFSKEAIDRIAGQAGFAVTRWFSDSRGWFSLVEFMLER